LNWTSCHRSDGELQSRLLRHGEHGNGTGTWASQSGYRRGEVRCPFAQRWFSDPPARFPQPNPQAAHSPYCHRPLRLEVDHLVSVIPGVLSQTEKSRQREIYLTTPGQCKCMVTNRRVLEIALKQACFIKSRNDISIGTAIALSQSSPVETNQKRNTFLTERLSHERQHHEDRSRNQDTPLKQGQEQRPRAMLPLLPVLPRPLVSTSWLLTATTQLPSPLSSSQSQLTPERPEP